VGKFSALALPVLGQKLKTMRPRTNIKHYSGILGLLIISLIGVVTAKFTENEMDALARVLT